MTVWRIVGAGLAAGLLAGCASVPRATTGPAFPDLAAPDIPARLTVAPDLRERHALGWQRLQAGDLRGASREYSEVLKRSANFYPAETGLGLVSLAGRQYKAAIERFKAAIERDSRYVPAWRGLASAELAQERLAEATAALERVVALDPSRAADRTRLELLKVKQVQQLADAGRRARQAGRLDAAADAYTRVLALSPASPLIMRELALVELAAGKEADAEARVRRALQLDATDADTHAALGQVLARRGKLQEAATVYARAASIDSKWRRESEAARAAAERSGLPDEPRDFAASATTSRGQLAAMIGIRLPHILERAPKRAPRVATDVPTHWAAAWITPVTQAGVMDVFANHTFQPAGAIQRVDLARVMSRLIPLALADRPADLARWQAARPVLSDLSPANLQYRAAALAVTAGVMKAEEGRFLPARPATGADVLAAIERLEQLTGKQPAP